MLIIVQFMMFQEQALILVKVHLADILLKIRTYLIRYLKLGIMEVLIPGVEIGTGVRVNASCKNK